MLEGDVKDFFDALSQDALSNEFTDLAGLSDAIAQKLPGAAKAAGEISANIGALAGKFNMALTASQAVFAVMDGVVDLAKEWSGYNEEAAKAMQLQADISKVIDKSFENRVKAIKGEKDDAKQIADAEALRLQTRSDLLIAERNLHKARKEAEAKLIDYVPFVRLIGGKPQKDQNRLDVA